MSTYFDIRLPADARRTVVWKEIVGYLAPWLRDAKSVLEIGAGRCSFINEVQAPRRLALDQDPETKRSAASGVEVREVDVMEIGALAETFDFILSSNFFEHLTQEQFFTLLPLLKAKLSSRGRVVIVQPNFRYAFREYFNDYTHKQVFTDEGLCGALEANGFRVVHCEPRFLPFSLKQSPSWVPLWLTRWGVWMYLRSPWKPKPGQMLVIAEKL